MAEAALIDGKAFSGRVIDKVAMEVAALKNKTGKVPGLAVVLVGDDAASKVYVKNKGEKTRHVGMNSYEYVLSATVTEAELIALVEKLNHDPAVHGILVQLPLPKHINEDKIINTISPVKDVDGFHVVNTGRLFTGQDTLVPCTPLGCLMLLKDTLGDLSGKHAVVVGRSNIVGKPMAMLLLKESCTVTIAHSRTKNLPELCRTADILVAAVGKPKMIQGDWVKKGAVVIDVGINRIEVDGKGKLVGDVDFESAKQNAAAITPVPGGVGPMTIACLLQNTLTAFAASEGVSLSNAA